MAMSATVFACLAVTALGARSYSRSGDWVTNERFYRRTIESGGGSVRVILNLGQIYAMKKEYARAEVLFRKALQMCPTYQMARNNLADVLHSQGKAEEAERMFREASAAAPEARKEFPRTWVAILNLAKLRVQAEDYPAALEILAQARRDYPNVWRLISLESELLRRTEGADAGLDAVQEFAQKNWWHAEAALALGKLYYAQGNTTQAEAELRHASRLDIHDATALNLIAALSMNQSRWDDAFAAQSRALARQPDEPRQYVLLSNILEKMGRTDEARSLLAQVTEMEAIARAQTAAN